MLDPPANDGFEILEWYPKYKSCQCYLLDHAQHSGAVQALAAFLNIQLPYQRSPPVSSSTTLPSRLLSPTTPSPSAAPGAPLSNHHHHSTNPTAAPTPQSPFSPGPATSLLPYIRRLVVTGLDFPGVLHGFFGDDWAAGIGPLHEQERRNYMFAAKSSGWAAVKRDYDMGAAGGGGSSLETVPFLRPLQNVVEQEVLAAEKSWSEFLAFEDWLVGSRAPPGEGAAAGGHAGHAGHAAHGGHAVGGGGGAPGGVGEPGDHGGGGGHHHHGGSTGGYVNYGGLGGHGGGGGGSGGPPLGHEQLHGLTTGLEGRSGTTGFGAGVAAAAGGGGSHLGQTPDGRWAAAAAAAAASLEGRNHTGGGGGSIGHMGPASSQGHL